MATMLLIGSAIILTMKMNHKMLVPFLQYVNVAHCNRLGSRSDLEASTVRRTCAPNVRVTSRSKKGCHDLSFFLLFKELEFLEESWSDESLSFLLFFGFFCFY